MILFLLNLLLALIWATATRHFSLGNLAVGFVLGYAILAFSRPVMGPSHYYSKMRQFFSDVDDDRSHMYVHTLFAHEERAVALIKQGLERRLLELLR